MKSPSKKEIKEMKKTWKGKWKLWRMGVDKFKQDPPPYRVHLMQGLSTILTMYMILFAAVYSVSIGLWIFALIIVPIGIIGNWYSAKSHLMKYKGVVKQFEMAQLIPPIEKDISNMRRRHRIIERSIGFLGVHVAFTLFTGVLLYVYFAGFSLWGKLGVVFTSIPIITYAYFGIIYKLCLRGYNHG